MNKKLNAIYELGCKLILLRDVHQIAETVLEIAARVLDFQDSDFLLVDESHRELYSIAKRGRLQPPKDLRLSLDGEEGITVAAARCNVPLYVPDVSQDPRYVYTGFSAASELAVPVQVEERVLGVINVESAQIDAFNHSDQELLTILANQAALAIENAQLHAEGRRQIKEMTTLNQLARQINASLDLQETLDAVVEAADELIPSSLAEISLWDEKTGMLTLEAIRCEPERAFPVGERSPPGEGYTGWVVRHLKPLLVPNVEARDDIQPHILPGEKPFKAYAGVPLLAGETFLGTLVLVADQPGAFDERDLSLLQALGEQASIAIRNARGYQEITRRHQELAALYTIAEAANRSLDLDELMQQALEKVIDVTNADAGGIRLYDQTTGELVITSFQGLGPEDQEKIKQLSFGEGYVEKLAPFRKPVVLRDLSKYPQLADIAAFGFDTHAFVPVMVKGETVGVLGVITQQPRDYTDEELGLLTAIGHQIGVAVENNRLYLNLSRRARELEAIHAVAAAVNRPGGLDSILAEGLKQALVVTGFAMGAIAVKCHVCNKLEVKSHQGMPKSGVEWLMQHLERKPLRVLPEDTSIEIEEIPPDSPGVPLWIKEEDLCLIADIPLFMEGVFEGLLTMATRKAVTFSTEVQSLLEAIGHQLGTAIANAQLRQDALTAERLAAVGRVATSVAHDLRSPLGGILRSAEFLGRPELSPDTRRKLSQAIVSLSHRLINTSQEILDYTRGGKLPLRLTASPLPEFLNEVLTVMEVDFSDRGIEVVNDWKYQGSLVMDPDRMAQVVINIATNARDAMPKGGTFTISTQKAGDWVEMRFTDTGPGVPRVLGERIFEPFFTYGKREGAGLGLAIARRIVEEHEGKLRLESGQVQGATFVVSLPG